jgi:UDP-glucose 4-epimerase
LENKLVTGGAGFIGSHLVEKLLKDGHNVTVLDNLSTGRLENIAEFLKNPHFCFKKGDILDKTLVEESIKTADTIYHLAAAVGVQLIADEPVRTIETNISGTTNILEACNLHKKRVFIASTSEAYGKSEKVPFAEDDDLVLGSTSFSRWSYACSKLIDEFLGLAFHQQHGLNVVIGRFFNTIGTKQTGVYGMVVPRFIKWALEGKPIQIYGNGRQTRCFCDVTDVVDAVAGLMDCPAAFGKVYNIGSTDEITIEQLADKVFEVAGVNGRKEFLDYEKAYGRPMDDMMRRVPNIARIKNAIGWQPKIKLEQTLQNIVKSMK